MKKNFITLCSIALPLAVQAQDKLNILYIMTDQQTASAMSCTGNLDLHTPNMDRLAQNGIMFSNAYCSAPLSTPSRASMFTGYMPSQIGLSENHLPMPDSLYSTTLGVLLSKAGYDCVYAGKWHVPEASMVNPSLKFRTLHNHNDYGLAESCIEYLEKRDQKPFFMVASFDNPHNICEYARKQNMPFAELVEPPLDDCPNLPSNFAVNPHDADVLQYEKGLKYSLYPTLAYEVEDWRRYLNAYYRLVEHVDNEIGKILNTLDKNGLWKNTIVLFTSDHGDGAASHQWNQKTVLYEEVTNVPLIVCHPKSNKTGTSLHLVNNGVDLMPTLCEIAQIQIPSGRQGVSFLPAIFDPSISNQDFVVTETLFAQTGGTRGWMLRTAEYKYVLYDKGKYREQLYEINKDKGEMRNLAVESKFKNILIEHRNILKNWMHKHPHGEGVNIINCIPQ